VNVELLDKTLNYVLDHPDEWEQSMWHCGSTGCFAYWACVLSGEPMEFVPGEIVSAERSRWLKCVEGDGVLYYKDGSELTSVAHRATRVLGLNENEAVHIFHCRGTRRDIRVAVKKVKEGVYR
jgi:hypothetical protein